MHEAVFSSHVLQGKKKLQPTYIVSAEMWCCLILRDVGAYAS